MNKHLQHIKSNQLNDLSNGPKLPDQSQLLYGELAINYNKDNEKLIFKNDSDEIVTVSTDGQNDAKRNVLANAILKVSQNCGLDEKMEYKPQNTLIQGSESIGKAVETLADNITLQTTNLVTKDELQTSLDTKQDKGDYALRSELFSVKYVEGHSDGDGYITSEIAPTGDNILIISRMYLHPTLNMWCHCVSYQGTDTNHIITGGIKYGVSVVVGGSTCQTFANCLYRVYYIELPQ